MKDYETMNLQTAEHYGYDKQSNQLIEECAELIQAINKHKRKSESVKKMPKSLKDIHMHLAISDVEEEIADVEVMLQQIKHLLGINPKYIEIIKQQKIERQRKRIAGE